MIGHRHSCLKEELEIYACVRVCWAGLLNRRNVSALCARNNHGQDITYPLTLRSQASQGSLRSPSQGVMSEVKNVISVSFSRHGD